MNTTKLQAFASESRTELMASIAVRMRTVLDPMSSARVDVPEVVGRLEEIIREAGGGDAGRATLVERYAYRWFNRIIAFRYMDVLGYTDTHVVSAEDVSSTNGLPEVLSNALRGVYDPNVFENDRVNRDAGVQGAVEALIDGTRTSDDPQGEAYGLLLQAYCRHWHEAIPSMFEGEENVDRKVDELLMPSDLLASGSVPRRALEAMTPEDCIITDNDGERRGNVEIIGWLYQFYISQRKDEVMTGFRNRAKAGAAEIPAATQLFTPDWIVQYLVQNTVGRLWMRSHPESQLYKKWKYYIPSTLSASGKVGDVSPYQGEVSAQPTEGVPEAAPTIVISSPEDLTVCDPACGSGHMLTYAFDLLYGIYEEQGYGPNEIPGLILEHNLYGMEIDERAANLAAFALTMKARDRYRRFFRKHVRPNIQRIEPVSFTDDEVYELNQQYAVGLDPEIWNTYAQADIIGSLIQPSPELASVAAQALSEEGAIAQSATVRQSGTAEQPTLLSDTLVNHETLAEKADIVLVQTRYLARKYTAVVANPPYMGSGNMGDELKDYVNCNYKDGKADLFAAFILRNLQLVQPNALLGMITMQSWMFLSSFENLRKDLITTNTIETMAHLGAGAFDSIGGEVVSTTAFTIRRTVAQNGEQGTYIRLVDIQGDTNQAEVCSRIAGSPRRGELTVQPIEGDVTPRIFTVSQSDFTRIPGSPIVYWLSDVMRATFTKGKPLEQVAKPRQGLATADNNRFIRLWWEVSRSRSSFDCESHEQAASNGKRWFPYNKGGEFRKWYGNQDYLVNWEKDGKEIRSFGIEDGGRIKSRPQNTDFYFLESVSWSNVTSGVPSFRYYPGGFIFSHVGDCLFGVNERLNKQLLEFSNSSVTDGLLQSIAPTLHFEVGQIAQLPFIEDTDGGVDNVDELVQTSRSDWDSYETSWDFVKVAIPGRMNRLQSDDSFNMDSSLSKIVFDYIAECKAVAGEQRQREIRNNELVADAYGVRGEVPCDVPIERVSLKRNPAFVYPKNTPAERDELMTRDLVKELISYAVGCMFGRYGIDKPGLILASQGEMLDDYLSQIPNPRFMPDEDNVIPVTSDEWFEDDIVSRFRRFLSVVYGEEHLSENVAYIEAVLGKGLRKYFVNDFYNDHVKMYKNRPIYWMYSSRTDNKGSFRALVYLHRYTPQTTSNVLGYLRDYVAKLDAQSKRLLASNAARDVREGEKMQSAITECRTYEDRVLYPLATRNLEIDLDDGVLVNYLRLGDALRSIPALERKRKEVTTWTWPHHKLEG